MGKSNLHMTSGDGPDENHRIFQMGFIHGSYDYLVPLCSYVSVRISRDRSNSTHNSLGLGKEGLNSGDYSLSLSLSLSLSPSLIIIITSSGAPRLISVPVGAMTTGMSAAGVHRGFLRKYGGFMFKQWKEKYLVLTMEGSLLVCRDAESPPDQVIGLQTNCESVAEGREILDLPRLPAGGRRDCCFALILPQNKFLLLLTDNPEDCSLWLNLIRKVREGFMSPLTLQRRCSITPCITDRDHLFDSSSVKDPGSPRICEGTPPLSRVTERGGSLRDRGQNQASGPRQPLRSVSVAPPHRQSDCLRHGNSSDARAVRAVCLLMGGAAASSALGYLNSCAPPAPLASRAPEIDHGEGGSFHACSQDVDSPHFNSFDFEGDSDFDAFDCGGFAF